MRKQNEKIIANLNGFEWFIVRQVYDDVTIRSIVERVVYKYLTTAYCVLVPTCFPLNLRDRIDDHSAMAAYIMMTMSNHRRRQGQE